MIIKSFRASWSDWDISWPHWRYGWSTIRLPVTFTLELGEESNKADCMVGQMKKGRSEIGGTGPDIFREWEGDSDRPAGNWWDGTSMASAGRGKWDSSGRIATFEDSPGFYHADAGKSLYMGDALRGPDYFQFKTFVKDRSAQVIKEINWSMRIDVPTPGNGGYWRSFSVQK